MISFRCRRCGWEVSAPDERVGGEYGCPACGELLVVPRGGSAGSARARAGIAAAVLVAGAALAGLAIWLARGPGAVETPQLAAARA
ncbi:MAG: hypothetical protein ACYTFI_14675, partial [Planctomycetota bacterium]